MRNVKTTKELYEKLIETPNLHSIPELNGEVLIWKLYKSAYVRAYCDSYDTCIDIISNSVFTGSLIHWHPDEEDMLDELHTLGKKENMLVLKKHYLVQAFSTQALPKASHSPIECLSTSERKNGMAVSWFILSKNNEDRPENYEEVLE